jgi:hypothetical protein
MFPKRPEVRVSGEPFEIAIAKGESFFESSRRQIEIAVKRIAASKIIIDERVAWFEPGQLLIYL